MHFLLKPKAFIILLMTLGLILPMNGSAAPLSAVAARAPLSYSTTSGKSGGEPVTNMAARDQSGKQDNPAAYVTFKTPAVVYQGYSTFSLPAGVSRGDITGMQVQINFKGPKRITQSWKWYLYNWTNSSWVVLGDNGNVGAADTWTLMTFNPSNPKRFAKPSTGEIRLQMRSGNSNGDAKLDYESLVVTYNQPAPPAPTRSATAAATQAGTRTPSPTGGSPSAPTASATRTSAPVASATSIPSTGASLAGCPLFPADHIWNKPIDNLPVHARSADWIASIGRNTGLHMDFGSGTWDGGPIGIPYNVVAGNLAKVSVAFDYADESDPGPYPIPSNPLIEWGGDHHILIVDKDNCTLYELYDASKSNGAWSAGSGAVWNLRSDALRPAGWTSADAAGLPMLPGLVRYDEIVAGQINHAIRFTAPDTQKAYLWPARHLASDNASAVLPPMGARFRLKASFDISGYPAQMQVLLRAMKKYGIILADNGSSWYISGAPDSHWNNDTLHLLDNITGNNFEAVDEAGLMVSSNSGAAKP